MEADVGATSAVSPSEASRDALAEKLQQLEQSVRSSKTRRWELRERIQETRAKLQGNAEAKHIAHAALDQLKAQSKLSDVLETRAALEDLRKKIELLEEQQRQCLHKLHLATAGEIPDLPTHSSPPSVKDTKTEQSQRTDAAMLELMNEAIVQLRIQSAERIAEVHQDRAALTRERLLVEHRLRNLRAQDDTQLVTGRSSDEPTLQEVFDMAAAMDSIVAANLQAARSSMKQLEDEASWLDNGHTGQWRELTKSLADRSARIEAVKHDVSVLRELLDAAVEAEELRESQNPLHSLDGQVSFLGDEIFGEVLQQLVRETAEYVHATCVYADNTVRRSILSSLLNAPPPGLKPTPNRAPARDDALALEVHRTLLDATAYEFAQRVSRSHTRAGGITVTTPTQHVAHIGDAADDRTVTGRSWTPTADVTVFARNSDGHRWIPGERIMMEQRISKGIHLNALPEKLTMPDLLGMLTVLEMCSSASLRHSTVFAGGSSGSFCAWTVPWSWNSKVVLTAVSPKLPHAEQSPVEQIRFSLDGTSQVVTLDAKGAVRIWSMEPVTRVGKKRFPHTPSMFPQNYRQFAPIVPACVAYLPFETLLFPQPPPFPKYFVQSPRTRATNVCFEASSTFTLRQPSVLIAVQNGDVIKFNTDYEVGGAAAPIVNPAAIPVLEYANPLGTRNGIEVFSADAERRGNKVRREIFNFHRAPLRLLSTAGQLDEWIVTVDADGLLAVWETWSRRGVVSVTGLHRPNRTCRIDLTLPAFTPVGEEVVLLDEVMVSDLESMGVHTSAVSAGHVDWGLIQAGYLLSAEIDERGYLLQCFGEPNPANAMQGTLHKLWIDTESNTVVQHVVANAHVTECSGSVVDIKLTSTREDICFLAEYSGADQSTKKVVISTLNLTDLVFTFPRYTFVVDEDNKVLDWAIGPLTREPLTFYAFVLSDKALRIISLVTGQLQRIVDLRTFVPRGTLNTKPQFVRVCGRQAALVLGSPTSRQLLCCLFSHDYDGLTLKEAKDIECLQYFHTLGAHDPKHYVTASLIDSERRDAGLDERERVQNLILDTIHGIVDEVIDSRAQEAVVEELFGEGPFGVVSPTTWTFPTQTLEQTQLATAMLLALEGDSSGDSEASDSEQESKSLEAQAA